MKGGEQRARFLLIADTSCTRAAEMEQVKTKFHGVAVLEDVGEAKIDFGQQLWKSPRTNNRFRRSCWVGTAAPQCVQTVTISSCLN